MNKREWSLIAIITFATVFVWIVFGISHARDTSHITPEEQQDIVPLTPNFDNDIIKSLMLREE